MPRPLQRATLEVGLKLDLNRLWGVALARAHLPARLAQRQFRRPATFFCQVKAAETIVWLTKVARTGRYAKFWEHLRGGERASQS